VFGFVVKILGSSFDVIEGMHIVVEKTTVPSDLHMVSDFNERC